MKDWIVTYKQDGETLQKNVTASCILKALLKSRVTPSSIIGCVLFVDPCVYMAVDLVKGPDRSVTQLYSEAQRLQLTH